jgi:hypothetical protein
MRFFLGELTEIGRARAISATMLRLESHADLREACRQIAPARRPTPASSSHGLEPQGLAPRRRSAPGLEPRRGDVGVARSRSRDAAEETIESLRAELEEEVAARSRDTAIARMRLEERETALSREYSMQRSLAEDRQSELQTALSRDQELRTALSRSNDELLASRASLSGDPELEGMLHQAEQRVQQMTVLNRARHAIGEQGQERFAAELKAAADRMQQVESAMEQQRAALQAAEHEVAEQRHRLSEVSSARPCGAAPSSPQSSHPCGAGRSPSPSSSSPGSSSRAPAPLASVAGPPASSSRRSPFDTPETGHSATQAFAHVHTYICIYVHVFVIHVL